VTEDTDRHRTLGAIYKERLLQLFRNPLGTETPNSAAIRGWAKNRSCGDEVSFFSLHAGDNVSGCWQDTAGCAISTATASLLVEAMAGKSHGECREMLQRIREMVFEGKEVEINEEIRILSAVHDLPTRHECVGVALKAAAQSLGIEAKTE
jgi:nitrogen fixation NifU-like protein